jgi:hypothetical protein
MQDLPFLGKGDEYAPDASFPMNHLSRSSPNTRDLRFQKEGRTLVNIEVGVKLQVKPGTTSKFVDSRLRISAKEH